MRVDDLLEFRQYLWISGANKSHGSTNTRETGSTSSLIAKKPRKSKLPSSLTETLSSGTPNAVAYAR